MESKKQEVERRLLENLPRLYKLAGWYASGRPIDSDDIVQLTCEQVIKHWYQWEGSGFDTWIRRIAFSQARDELRRQHRRQGVDVDTTLIADNVATSRIEALLMLKDIDKVWPEMLQEYREVLLVVGLEGYSYAEAAQILDIPQGTVMSRVKRARSAAKKLLGAKS